MQAQVYSRYYRGLSLIAKNDLFGELAYGALVEFYEALKAGLGAYDGWDGDPNSFSALAEHTFSELTSSSDNMAMVSEFKRLIEAAAAISNQKPLNHPVGIDDAFKLKVMSDIYLLSRIRREMSKINAPDKG